MGFYLRKSIKVGPVRFNLSKSGIGVSAGVKGLRFGTGPRGNYIHMGRGGLYYRATIPAKPRHKPVRHPRPIEESMPRSGDSTHDPLQEIESVDVLEMKDSNSAELLEELNSKRRKVKLFPFAIIGSLVAIFAVVANYPAGWAVGAVILASMVLTFIIYQRDQLAKTAVLFYELEPTVEKAYQTLHDAFDHDLPLILWTRG